MKIITALKSGLLRIPYAWKGIFAGWLASLILAALTALPVKNALKQGLGNSLIVERLMNGLDGEVLTELGPALRIALTGLVSGIVLMTLAGLILNSFINGGIFNSVRGGDDGSGFWKACGKNFFPFLFISFITGIITFVAGSTVTSLPFMFIDLESTYVEREVSSMSIIVILVFTLLVLPVMLLVADYARAWQARQETNRFFSAIGFGFRQTFSTFLSSWPVMTTMVVIQVLYLVLMASIILRMIPETSGGVFTLLIVSQMLYAFKIVLRIYRYASVTALLEETLPAEKVYSTSL